MRIIINEENAKTTKVVNSFRDYKPMSATNEYVAECEEVENKIKEVDEKYQDQIIKLVDRFTTKLGNYLNDYYRNEASCPSIMICGGGNFPVRKKERQNSRRDTLMQEYNQIMEMKKSILNFKPRLDQDDELTRLIKEIEQHKKQAESMKAINAHYRKYNNLDTFEGIKEETKKTIIEDLKNSWRGENAKPFESFHLTSIREKIKRLENNLAKLTAPKQESKEKELNGVKIIQNTDLNRLQLLFDDIPSEEVRTELKRNGFKWSPLNKAWQRQLTNNALYSLKFLSFLK